MSVRAKIKSLMFYDADDEWEGLFGEQLAEMEHKFRLELHGDELPYTGIVTGTRDSSESTVAWDNMPPGEKQVLGNLERFVGIAFRASVHVRLVVEPVNLDEVESEYLAEEDEEDEEQ